MIDQEEFLRKIVQHLNTPQNKELYSEIQALIEQSAGLKQTYEQTIFIWNNLADAHEAERINVDEAVLELETKILALQNTDSHQYSTTNSKGLNLKRWAAIAAMLLVGILVYSVYNFSNKANFIVKQTQASIDSVTLADGSKIYLDAYSELKYPSIFKGDTRQIDLVKGQAFFKIHRDTLHPFVVMLRRSSVTVLGTSFNIDTRGNQIILNVKTGIVRFQPLDSQGQGTVLYAGTGVVYNEITGKELTLNSTTNNNQYWLSHEITFVDASLIDVCKQLEEAYKVKITLSGKTAVFKKLNAHFTDNNLTSIMEVLRNTYPIKIKQVDTGSFVIYNISK